MTRRSSIWNSVRSRKHNENQGRSINGSNLQFPVIGVTFLIVIYMITSIQISFKGYCSLAFPDYKISIRFHCSNPLQAPLHNMVNILLVVVVSQASHLHSNDIEWNSLQWTLNTVTIGSNQCNLSFGPEYGKPSSRDSSGLPQPLPRIVSIRSTIVRSVVVRTVFWKKRAGIDCARGCLCYTDGLQC